MYFYHVYGPLDRNDRIYQALKNGLTPSERSNWASRGGGAFYPDLINRLKSGDPDDWMDFTESFAVFASPMSFANYLRFPLANNEIFVFNRDLTTDLFGYVEEEMHIGSSEYQPGMFTDDLPSKEDLMKQYWNSRMNLSSYLEKEPYAKPEYLCFHDIPSQLLEGFIDGKKI